MASAIKLETPIHREHPDGLTQPDGSKVYSRQDWTEPCPAYRVCAEGKECTTDDDSNWIYTSETNCPMPVAKGYDHMDQEVTVSTRIYLVDEEGTEQDTLAQQVDWSKRSTYLFKYDGTDSSGNHAEQVVFALILKDSEAPFFKTDCKSSASGAGEVFQPAITVEALSDWYLCELDAVDNVERDIDFGIQYQIQSLGRQHASAEFSSTYGSCSTAEAGYNAEMQDTDLTWNDYAEAARYMGTWWEDDVKKGDGAKFVGKFLVTARVSDTAGIYGHSAINNERDLEQAILVRDTTDPVMSLVGSNPETTECRKEVDGVNVDGTAYTPTQDVCGDSLDSEALGWTMPITTTYYDTQQAKDVSCDAACPATSSPLAPPACPGLVQQMARRGEQTLKYSCEDVSGNAAPALTRAINTVDTTAPTITLVSAPDSGPAGEVIYPADDECTFTAEGKHEGESGITKLYAALTDQVSAEDSCDSAVDTSSVTVSWGAKEFNCRVPGDYVRTYSVKDQDDNEDSVTRTFTVTDESDPVITVVGDNEDHEATRDEEYTDKGATCADLVDGVLNHAVEVSGDVVNMQAPGEYVIAYNCQDLSGLTAATRHRTVTVKDTTDPELTLLGASINYIEAGFPYVDAGATATDTLDGDLTATIWTEGDVVDRDQTSFWHARSCQEVYNLASANGQAISNGKYFITAEVDSKFSKIQVHCFFAGGKGYTFKEHVAGAAHDCASMGLVKAEDSLEAADMAVITAYVTQIDADQANILGNLDDYLCTVDPTKTQSEQVKAADTVSSGEALTATEKGLYVVQFHVQDAAENKATPLYRTVVVKDTLPPVITLHLKDKLVHVGGSDKVDGNWVPHNIGIDGSAPTQWNPAAYPVDNQYNPAAGYTPSTFGNPNMSLMAETSTSVNGWIVGAVGSAVAGVALLSYSARKPAAVTSVPV